MNSEHLNIDKLFEQGLKGHRSKTPRRAWDRLNYELDQLQGYRHKYIFRWAAAVILILMAFGAGYFFATLNNSGVPLTDEGPTAGKEIRDLRANESGNQPIKELPDVVADETSSTVKSASESNSFSELKDFSIQGTTDHKNRADQVASAIIFNINRLPSINLSSLPVHDKPALATYSTPGKSASKQNTELLEPLLEYPYDDIAINSKSTLTKWTVGAQFAPTYSYREISVNYGQDQTGMSDPIDELNHAEDALFSYAGGVNIDYHLSKRWSLQSGMYYSRIGQVNNDALNFKQENSKYVLFSISTSTGAIDVVFESIPDNVRKLDAPKDSINIPALENIKVIQNFDLFEIPFVVKYQFLNRKFTMNLSGGLSPAYLVDNNTYLEVSDEKYDIGNSANLNNMIVNSSLGLGFGYHITPHLTFSFEPTFKYALSPINNNSEVNYHPYYLSWFTGINFKF